MIIWTHMVLAAVFDFQAAQFWIDVGSIVLTIILAIPTFWPKKGKKRLSYRILSDAALIDETKDLGEHDIQITIEGNQVTNARLIMMQLINTGPHPIQKDEYEYENESKIRFEFNPVLSEPSQNPVQPPQSPLVLCAVHATNPDGMMSRAQQINQLTLGRLPTSHSPLYDYVDVMGTLMNPGDYINLKFLTQGKVKITQCGRLVGGPVEPYVSPPQLITPWRIVLIVVVAMTVAVFNLGLGLIEGFVHNNCALSLSTIADGGSTAFYNTAQIEAGKYHSTCLLGSVSVSSNSSGAGLRSLENHDLQIANSELSLKEVGYSYTDLQEYQVAVIAFTIIVNKHLSAITSLSRDQITGIYNGTITNWQSVGGPNLTIKVIGRPNDSGTHAAFTRFVLDQAEKPVSLVEGSTQGVIDDVSSDLGAIGYVDLGSANQASNAISAIEIDGNSATVGLIERDNYRFWAIERMYTKQNAEPLAVSFINYIIHDIQTNGTFIRIGDMPRSVLKAHE